MFRKNALRLFGQMFDCPFPLEISSYAECQYACNYCFSNLGRIYHKQKAKKLGKEVKEYSFDNTVGVINKMAKAFSDNYNSKDPLEYFLRNKYPIIYSNNTDPFCGYELEHRCAEKLLTTFAQFQYPVFIQTKNPYINDEYIELMKKNKDNYIIYVTLCSTDDKITRMLEKNSPLASERIEKIKRLVAEGFEVMIGMSPYFDGLSDEVKSYANFAHKLGVKGIWFDYMHLNKSQKKIFDTFSPGLGVYANIPLTRQYQVVQDLVEECEKLGLHYEFPVRYMDKLDVIDNTPYLNTKFDNVVDFCSSNLRSHLHKIWIDNGKLPLIVKWDSLYEMIKHCPELKHIFSTHKFFASLNTKVTMDTNKFFLALGKENTLENILRYAWNDTEEILQWIWCSESAYVMVNNDNEFYRDDNGNDIMVFHPEEVEKENVIDGIYFNIDEWEEDYIEL